MSRFIVILVFAGILAAIVIDGLGFDWVPVAIEEQWSHHAAAFALLVFSARLAFPRTLMFWTFLYAVLLALFLELAQGLLPQQSTSVLHMAANLGGIIIGVLAAQVWRRQVVSRLAEYDR
jgi:glycopeptide antibiotics resistance protein